AECAVAAEAPAGGKRIDSLAPKGHADEGLEGAVCELLGGSFDERPRFGRSLPPPDPAPGSDKPAKVDHRVQGARTIVTPASTPGPPRLWARPRRAPVTCRAPARPNT